MRSFQCIFFILTIWLLSACVDPVESNEAVHQLALDNPTRSALLISNPGTASCTFTMKLNGLLFHNEEDMKTHVEQTKIAQESMEISAWRLVKDHSYFEEPLTDTSWIHGPLIFLNSLGFGYCDDKAATLAFLWEQCGFFSRVWSLGGHVVPEVHDGDLWRMYDPEYEVFYRMPDSSVASVQDLMTSPGVIRYGFADQLPCNNIHGLWNRYSYKTAEVYFSAENNAVTDWYSEPLGAYEFEVTIPPGGSFEFPGKYESPLLNYVGDTINAYANARLTIPKSWSGEIKIPLVVHTIKGAGSVLIDADEFEIGSARLTDLINARQTFIHEFSFTKLKTDVEIVYLINPLLTDLHAENILELKGTEVANLEVGVVSLANGEIYNRPDRYTFPSEVYNIKSYVHRLPQYTKLRITEVAKIHSKLMLLITSNTDLSQEQMTEKYDLISENINSFFGALLPKVNTDALLKALNDDVNFAIFISLMEHVPAKELARIISANTNLKNHGDTDEPRF